MMEACRTQLREVLDQKPASLNRAHAGLLLASYLKTTDDQGAGKRVLLVEAIQASRRGRALYQKAFERWKNETTTAVSKVMAVRGRLIIGLGTENVLETGITLHHTYGIPVIPGSALKGLANHFCDRVWGRKDPEFRRRVVESETNGVKKNRAGAHYLELFGATEEAGHIWFHDAWILPESLQTGTSGLLLDVITPHHGDYYMASPNDTTTAPTDFDDPNCVAFLSVAGKFRFVVECDASGENGSLWALLAMKLLTEALTTWGVGGKTAAAYGRFLA
jgi:CRISPR-associated protein Cmr6